MRALTDHSLPRLGCVLVALLAATAATAQAPPPAASERAEVIAVLERLMMTGEPQHTDHDEGEWLQAQVNAAIARRDIDLYQLARRAAAPLIPSVSRPDLAYALYDPAAEGQYDARVFVMSPAWAKASSLDPNLPDVRFDAWLAKTLAKRGASSDPRRWRAIR